MRYLYKKNKANIYKRRIPNTQAFFSFNTNIYNIKNAQKFVIIFNRLSHDLWNYLRLGKQMDFNLREIYEILEDYKTKATEEYIRLKNKKQHKNYEELRHEHLKKLFPIKKHDPILGEITLSGADKKVLKTAKESFKNLAIGSYSETKPYLKKIGKEITARSTDELKSLYAKMRNCKDEKQFLDFLSMLLKTEAEILKIDEQRAKNRFGDKTTVKNDEIVEDKRGFTSEELEKNKSIEEIQEYFLTSTCCYTKEQLEDSKNSAYKQKKVCNILKDLLEDNNEYTADFITFNRLKEVLHIIPKIPRKMGNITGAYSYYLCYKNNPNSTKEELRSSTSTRKDLSSLKRYIDFLELKEYISPKEKRELNELIKTSNLATNKEVIKGERTAIKNKVAFKDSMLKAIFNRQNRPYKIVFDKLENEKLKDNKDLLVARFYAPLLMFFTGSRLAEIVQLKTEDCEIREDNTVVWLYIEANEQKGSKTASSKRIIPVHNFLSNNLNLLNYIKKAQVEKREYLFNTLAKDEDKISKEFNRHKDFLIGNLGKEDIFQNTDYTLYSFRHTYKTHLENLGVNETVINKLQGHTVDKVVEGYFSINDEVVENVNKFKKHEIVEDWSDFIKLSESLSNY